MTPEERAKHLMLKLFTRNDDGSWAGHFPNATDDLHHQQGIIASIIREAIHQARAEMREEAARVAEELYACHVVDESGGPMGPTIGRKPMNDSRNNSARSNSDVARLCERLETQASERALEIGGPYYAVCNLPEWEAAAMLRSLGYELHVAKSRAEQAEDYLKEAQQESEASMREGTRLAYELDIEQHAYTALQQENERYRAALEEIALLDNRRTLTRDQMATIARAALERQT